MAEMIFRRPSRRIIAQKLGKFVTEYTRVFQSNNEEFDFDNTASEAAAVRAEFLAKLPTTNVHAYTADKYTDAPRTHALSGLYGVPQFTTSQDAYA